MCRKTFEKSGIRLASDVENTITIEMVKCVDCQHKVGLLSIMAILYLSSCHLKMRLIDYNAHLRACKNRLPVDVTFKPVAHSSQPVPK